MNEGLKLNNEIDFRIIKDDTKMWFRDYDTDWRRQERQAKIHRLLLDIFCEWCPT